MFAPKPFDVAKEMVRVTRPGGRIVMGNWIPDDPTLVAQVLRISAAYTPPPPQGFISPMTWGIKDKVIERFASAGVAPANVSFARDTYTFHFAGTPSEFVEAFKSYYGPTMNAFEAAEESGRAGALRQELDALFESQKISSGKSVASIPGNVPPRDGCALVAQPDTRTPVHLLQPRSHRSAFPHQRSRATLVTARH